MVVWSDGCAIVTGGADGMGLEIALALVASGCSTALVDLSEERLVTAQEKCLSAASGPAVVSVHVCDVCNASAVADLPRAVSVSHKKLAHRPVLLFNCAGIMGGNSFVTSNSTEWDRAFDVNWGGVVRCTRAFLPILLASPSAHVINIASICGCWAQVGFLQPNSAYCAAKFAVRGFTLSLYSDFQLNAPHVRVSCVMPGWVGTGLAQTRQQRQGTTALQRMRDLNATYRKRVAELRSEKDAVTLALDQQNILHKRTVDLSKLSDEQLSALAQQKESEFRARAPTSAAEAARIILEGVAQDKLQILVGQDAKVIDRLLREHPEAIYEDGTMVPEFFDFSTWAVNRKGKVPDDGQSRL